MFLAGSKMKQRHDGWRESGAMPQADKADTKIRMQSNHSSLCTHISCAGNGDNLA
jgi:hypothetical protein